MNKLSRAVLAITALAAAPAVLAVAVAEVPESSSVAMLVTGLAMAFVLRKKR